MTIIRSSPLLRTLRRIGTSWVCLALFNLCGTLSGAEGSTNSKPGKSRPNVIILLQDDVGPGDLSVYGNPILRTPNIDRICKEGVSFSQFHVAPMCTPTRGMLMSGVHCMRNGARQVGTDKVHLRTDLPTNAELFRSAGYRTGMFGKWHLGDAYPLRPQDRGFEETLWFPQAALDKVGDYWGNDYFDDYYFQNGVRKQFQGYAGDIWFSEATKWMRQCAEKKEAFFAYIPNNLAHGHFFVPAHHREKYSEALKDKRKETQSFAGMMDNIDENIGRLEDFLKETGLYDNTIVVYLQDNGPVGGKPIYDCGLRGMKGQFYEGGHRSPLFVRWPDGKIAGGRVVDGLTGVQDLLPTLLDLVGIPVPKDVRFDGISLAPAMRGESAVPDRTMIVQHNVPKEGKACVMWRQWRLVEDKELYDLESDPSQKKNVMDQHPEIVAQLRKEYAKWWGSIQSDLAINTPIIIGNDAENPLHLFPCSWSDTYLVDNRHVRSGEPRSGTYLLKVDQAGEYEIALRRWPEEVDLPIRSAAPPVPLTDTFLEGPETAPGVALPIAKAELIIDSKAHSQLVTDSDKAITFRCKLQPGPIQLQAQFRGEDGKTIWGAYSISVRRL